MNAERGTLNQRKTSSTLFLHSSFRVHPSSVLVSVPLCFCGNSSFIFLYTILLRVDVPDAAHRLDAFAAPGFGGEFLSQVADVHVYAAIKR